MDHRLAHIVAAGGILLAIGSFIAVGSANNAAHAANTDRAATATDFSSRDKDSDRGRKDSDRGRRGDSSKSMAPRFVAPGGSSSKFIKPRERIVTPRVDKPKVKSLETKITPGATSVQGTAKL